MDNSCDLAVVGGGPGGYVAALRGAQLKLRVILIEKDRLGGTCMNWGCIPTKYLLHQTLIFQEMSKNRFVQGLPGGLTCDWKGVQAEKREIVRRLVEGIDFLLQKNGVKVVRGTARQSGENIITVTKEEGEEAVRAKKIILATGSRTAGLPFLKPNGIDVLTSREALDLEDVPQTLLVVGAGAIGLELGTVFQRLGTAVTILEILPTILPGSDRAMVTRLERMLKMQGLDIFTNMRIEKSRIEERKVRVEGTCLKDKKPFVFEAEKLLLAVGRWPNSEGLIENEPANWLDNGGSLRVNDRLETAVPGVYAIGDLIGGKLLAHKASHEGLLAAENAAGKKKNMDYAALPSAVYTEPEMASVGLTEEEARELGITTKIGLFSLQASSRALILGKTKGMVKVIADQKERIIGAHILAPQASELITEMTLAVGKGLTLQDVAGTIHVHPSLSESVMEAAMKAQNRALHALNI